MILADKVEYKFRRILLQKHGDCSTHAFLGVMAELVENKTGIPTDFNYYEERKKMGGSFALMKRIATKAIKNGFRTIDNRLVKASKVISVGRYTKNDNDGLVNKLCTMIQQYGPCVATFRWNKNSGTNLVHGKGGVLDRIFQYVRKPFGKDEAAHAISITGFDRRKKVFTLTNSWGEKMSIRYIKFKDISKIFRTGMFIEDVIVTKK
jgi:hypothetical protein